VSEDNGPTYQDEQTPGFNRDRLVKLPEGWEWICVGDLAMGDIQTGPFGAQLHRSDFVPFGVPVLAIGNVGWGYVNLDEIDHVTPGQAEQLQRYILHTGDVLFTRSGTVGRSAVLPQEADGYLMTGHILRIRLNSKLYLPELLFRAFQGEPTMARQLQSHTRGMTRAGFNTSLLSGLVVPVPPPTEQRRIVAKIEALQERGRRAREALAEVGPLLEQFRQSVLAAAFRGDLTADWRTAHPNVEPASELLHRIRAELRRRWEQAELAQYEAKGTKPPKNWQDKYEEPEPVDDTGLPELPEGWCWARFDEVLSELHNGISPKPNDAPPGTPILRINSVRPRKVLLDELRYLPNADNYIKTYHLRDRDLLFTRYNGSLELLGVCGLVQGLGDRMVLYPDKLMRVRIEHQLVLPEFIEMYFASPDARQRIASKAKTTSGQQGVSGADIKAQPVPLAPLSEQQQLVTRLQVFLTTSDKLEAALSETYRELDRLDHSILAKAFRGELVPQDPSDEPASVLLERIRVQREQQGKATKKLQRRNGGTR
jgi:type I restriction enzyme S subunit